MRTRGAVRCRKPARPGNQCGKKDRQEKPHRFVTVVDACGVAQKMFLNEEKVEEIRIALADDPKPWDGDRKKQQNLQREQINLKSTLKSIQQRVQVLRDVQISNGGGAGHGNASPGPSSPPSSSSQQQS